MASEHSVPEGEHPEDAEQSLLEQLPRILFLIAVSCTVTFVGFAVYLASIQAHWTTVIFFAVTFGVVALIAYRWMRRQSAGAPLPTFGSRRSRDVPTDAPEEEQPTSRERALDLKDKIVFLRYIDEINQAFSDLDQTGECVLSKSILAREGVSAEQMASIFILWISEEYGMLVDITSKEIARGRVRYRDPDWEQAGQYSGETLNDDAGPTSDEDQ